MLLHVHFDDTCSLPGVHSKTKHGENSQVVLSDGGERQGGKLRHAGLFFFWLHKY